MICPHCGKETGALEMKPAKVKNFQALSWCNTCGKPKAYSCTLLFGDAQHDPDAEDMPPMCSCPMVAGIGGYNPMNPSYTITV